MNKCELVGRIATDIESRTTANGTAVVSFRIAVQRRFKNANGTYDADFISCVAWRNTAEFIAKHFAKGSMIGLAGSIQTRSYTAQDGSKRYATEVIVDEAEFVGSKTQSPAVNAPAPDENGFTEMPPYDGDLPF